MLYKYPQAAFPYEWLIGENGRRGRLKPEFELVDTGIFNDDAYFDIDIRYAKADLDDILWQITAVNRGQEGRTAHRAAANLVSQHLDLVRRRRRSHP